MSVTTGTFALGGSIKEQLAMIHGILGGVAKIVAPQGYDFSRSFPSSPPENDDLDNELPAIIVIIHHDLAGSMPYAPVVQLKGIFRLERQDGLWTVGKTVIEHGEKSSPDSPGRLRFESGRDALKYIATNMK